MLCPGCKWLGQGKLLSYSRQGLVFPVHFLHSFSSCWAYTRFQLLCLAYTEGKEDLPSFLMAPAGSRDHENNQVSMWDSNEMQTMLLLGCKVQGVPTQKAAFMFLEAVWDSRQCMTGYPHFLSFSFSPVQIANPRFNWLKIRQSMWRLLKIVPKVEVQQVHISPFKNT